MEHYDQHCGYVLGNQFDYPEFEQVYTIDLFFKRFFQGELPHYQYWVIGQGLTVAERQMLLKLQSVCPSLQFSSGAFDASQMETTEQIIELQYFYPIGQYHYQAELYVTDELKPSILMEGLDKLLTKGFDYDFPGHLFFVKNANILQIRKLLPLSLSVEARFDKEFHPNSHYATLKGKARFYQENHCMAEITCLIDIEKAEVSKKFESQAAAVAFNQEKCGQC